MRKNISVLIFFVPLHPYYKLKRYSTNRRTFEQESPEGGACRAKQKWQMACSSIGKNRKHYFSLGAKYQPANS